MGDVEKVLAEEIVSSHRIEGTRACVDLCEDIHLHWRNYRLEFTLEEFRVLALLIARASNGIEEHVQKHGYSEGWTGHKQWRHTIPPQGMFAGRLRVELNRNGVVHVHDHEVRTELTPAQARVFARALAHASGVLESRAGSVPLRALKVQRWEGAPEKLAVWSRVPLGESPFYRALRAGDRSIYDAYRARVCARPGKAESCCTWADFMDLRDSVLRGWRADESLPLEKDKRTLMDGQHRAAVLLFAHPGLHVRISERRAYPCLPHSAMTYRHLSQDGGTD